MVSGVSIKHVLFLTDDGLKFSALADAFRKENITVKTLNDTPAGSAFVEPAPDLVLFDLSHESAVLNHRETCPACFIPIAHTPDNVDAFQNTWPFSIIWSVDGDHPDILMHRLMSFTRLSRGILPTSEKMTDGNTALIKLNILNDLLLSLDDHLRLSDALSVAAKYFDRVIHYDLLFFYSLWSDNIVLLSGEGVSPRLKDAIHILSETFLEEKNPEMTRMIPDFRYSDSENPVRDERIRDSLLFPFPSSGRFSGIIGFLSHKNDVYKESDRSFFEDLTRQIETILNHLENIVRKKQEQQILTIFDQINDAVAIIDLQKESAYVNHYFQDLMGKYQKIIPYEELIHFFPQDWEKVQKTCIEDKKVYRHKVFLGENKADRLVFDTVTDRFRNLPFIENGLILVARNITDNQQVEDMKADLISNVSHELKTPVAIVKEYVSLMADGIGGTLSPDHQEFNTIIAKNLERLERLINNVFDVMKTEKTRRKQQITDVDIPDLIQEVVDLFKVRYASKNMTLTTKVKKDLPTIPADRDALMQILVNFVENAYKYSEENSEVIIFADIRKDGDLYMYVKDHGRGIAKKDQDKIFQRFFRTGLDLERLPGAGLGLSITKDIVEQMGGEIWFESELNKGTTVFVTIPGLLNEE
jgi:signal transduction histidine kinase